MKLQKLIEGLPVIEVIGDTGVEIDDLYYDSRRVKKGGLFFAINGLVSNGHDFIPGALKGGAVAIVAEEITGTNDEANARANAIVRVKDSRAVMGTISNRFFKDPSMKLKLMGITGTNGKTTICYIVEEMLKRAGLKAGIIGTINYRYSGMTFEPPHTTPESLDLLRLMEDMVEDGVTHVAVEVSSHALNQMRVEPCMFDAAVFTNLTQDHLDYHGTMEKYFKSKARFFRDITGREKETTSIINIDDPWGAKLANEIEGNLVTYGFGSDADIRITSSDTDTRGVRGEMSTPEGKIGFDSNLLGRHNLYNIMAATGGALGMGVTIDAIREAINLPITIPGRLEVIEEGQDFLVLVDYAHTDDALKNVLTTLRPLTENRLITLFGCGGDRDKRKRPMMARAAADLSHKIVVTSDNPRTEDPDTIISDILEGFDGLDIVEVGTNNSSWDGPGRVYSVVPDRRKAIEFAVKSASKGDIVLIAGKGHEDYQIFGTKKYPFDDRVEAALALEEKENG